MSSNSWVQMNLGNSEIEIIDGDRGKNYPNGTDFSEEGYCLFLNAKNVTSNGFHFNEKMFITKDKDKVLRKGKLLRNDIIVTTRGTVGNVAHYSEKIKYTNMRINSGMVILRCPATKVLPEYAYWLFKSPNIQDQILSIRTGSAQPQLPISVMKNLEFSLPPIKEQRTISNILSCLDEKIDMNERINDNLNEQAQLIFKEMFIPSTVPTDWKETTVGSVCLKVTDGVHNTIIDDPNGKYLLLSCKNIKGGKISIGTHERTINAETFIKLRKRTKLSKGDILLSSVGTIGELVLLNTKPVNIEFQRSVAMMKPNPELVSSAYLYEALLSQKAEIINAAHGAVQQCLFLGDISGFKIILPPLHLINKFDDIVMPILDKITDNHIENIHLATTRDLLLPKLMSGDIIVSENSL